MSINSSAQNPLGYTGIDFYQNPPLQRQSRAPLSSDIYNPWTAWFQYNVSPTVMWYTTGAGVWYKVGTGSSSGILTVTGNSGGAISPTGGNVNILGTGGVNVTGSGSTLTISASSSGITWTDEATSFTASVDEAYFLSSPLTLTLPPSPSQGTFVYVIVTASGSYNIRANTGQVIAIGDASSSSGGNAANTAVGDSLELYYRAADSTWWSNSTSSTWILT